MNSSSGRVFVSLCFCMRASKLSHKTNPLSCISWPEFMRVGVQVRFTNNPREQTPVPANGEPFPRFLSPGFPNPGTVFRHSSLRRWLGRSWGVPVSFFSSNEGAERRPNFPPIRTQVTYRVRWRLYAQATLRIDGNGVDCSCFILKIYY